MCGLPVLGLRASESVSSRSSAEAINGSVISSAGDNGGIAPAATRQLVDHGETVDLTFAPDANYTMESDITTCGSDCFAQLTFMVQAIGVMPHN